MTLLPLDHAARRDAARRDLGDVGVDALLVTGPSNVRYLSGFSGSNGQVLLAGSSDADRLITDGRYQLRAGLEVRGLTVEVGRDALGVVPALLRGARLGFEADHVTVSGADRLRARAREADVEVVATSGLVEALRIRKDAGEIARIAEACRVTTDAFVWLLERMRPGVTERELAVALERRFVDLGADGPAFASIVASGPNGAIPHHEPVDRPVADGDLVTVDAGAMIAGYRADCTRTVAVGRPDARLVELHEVVRRAQEAGRAAAVAGAAASDVDRAARGIVADAGHGDAFVHGTGHGVGLDIHEAPGIGPEARDTLPVGAVFTVEPGIYLPDVGGVRIEDTLVVGPDGPPQPLTDIPRELLVL